MRQICILLVLYHSSYQQSGSSEEDPAENDDEFDCDSLDCFSQLNANARSSHNLTCRLSEHTLTNPKLLLCYKEETKEDCSRMTFKEHQWSVTKSFVIVNNYTIYQLIQKNKQVCKVIDLRKIVKPDPPFDVNVNPLEKAEEFVIHFKIHKHKYLQQRLLHEVVYRCKDSEWKNMSNLKIQEPKLLLEELQPDCNYVLKVRTIPDGDYFSGFWSDWSPTVQFSTPPARSTSIWKDILLPIVISISVCIIFVIIILLYIHWENRIKPCIWPNIPTPKSTLEQLYKKPVKELYISFYDEYLMDATIDRVEKIENEGVMSHLLSPSAAEDTDQEFSHEKDISKQPCHQVNCDAASKTISVTLDTRETLGTSDPSSMNKENVSQEDNGKLSDGMISNSAGDSILSGSPQVKFPSQDDSAACPQQSSANQSQTEDNSAADSLSVIPQVPANNITQTTIHDEAYVTMSSFYKTQ